VSGKGGKPVSAVADAVPEGQPQVTPRPVGMGHPEYNFLNGLMELQKSAARTDATIESLQKTVDETKTKVSRIEKTMYIATGIIVFAVAVGGWMANSVKDVAMLYFKATIDAQQQKQLPAPPASTGQTKQRQTP
jgi:hypothetical protein